MPHDELADLVARATAAAEPSSERSDDGSAKRRLDREKALAALLPVLIRSARQAGVRAVAAGRWLADLVQDVAPRLPIRDAQALRKQYPGLTDIEIAERLIRTATKTTAALGAAAGGLAAVEFFSPPALLAAPVQLAAEILTVTAVELKMVAELHEILGYPARGSVTDRAGLYLMSWVHRRAVAEQVGSIGIGSVLGVAAKRELRSQLLRRIGRSTTSLAPFLAGAAAGAEVNRRATKQLGQTLLAELRGRADERWFRQL
ncbi:MAG TPA: hypothetical protein VJ851_01715 [Jatrophihabitans sp.]|nr:hypothetical protein [Jatrophihabitans sp.]